MVVGEVRFANRSAKGMKHRWEMRAYKRDDGQNDWRQRRID